MSSDDEEGRTTRSTRRGASRVDLSKLDVSSLNKYRKHYKLGEAPAGAQKEDLVPAVTRHFASMPLMDEEELLLKFVLVVQKHNKQAHIKAAQMANSRHQQQQQNHQMLLQQQLANQQYALAMNYQAVLQQQHRQQQLIAAQQTRLKGGVVKPTR